jgi:hypothetical protein
VRSLYITRQSERRDGWDKYLPWVMVLLFTVGLVVSKVWPAYEHLLGLGFYAWLGALAVYVLVITLRVRRQPTNYRSLRLSDTSLEYEPLQNRKFSMDWQEIESVVFCREEAVFPDPGPYLETKWFIKKQGGQEIEVMDEWSNRAPLFRAFRERLPGFDTAAARRGMHSREEGRWLCFQLGRPKDQS